MKRFIAVLVFDLPEDDYITAEEVQDWLGKITYNDLSRVWQLDGEEDEAESD